MIDARESQADSGPARIQARNPRKPAVWVSRTVLFLLSAVFIKSLLVTPGFQWGVVADYMTASSILAGVLTTVVLTIVAMVISISLGILLAVMRLSSDRIAAAFSAVYTTAFRGTPLLVQLFFWYNIAALYPRFSIGIPFGPVFGSWDANQIVSPLFAAVVAIGLNEAAYMSEIIRAGIQSVDKGQVEAARALGMTSRQTFRRVVLPQATRLVLPPTGNETIGMLKYTSVVSVIGMSDLLFSAQAIYTRTYEVIPLLIVASIWYFILTTILAVGQAWLEARLRPQGQRTSLRDVRQQLLTRAREKLPGLSGAHAAGRN